MMVLIVPLRRLQSSGDACRAIAWSFPNRASNVSGSAAISGAVPKQLLEMPLNIAVAFARGGLQARAVEYGHAAIRVLDQVSVFQGTSGDGHTGPANPQHQ